MRQVKKRWILMLLGLGTAVTIAAMGLPDWAAAAGTDHILPRSTTMRDNLLSDPLGSGLALLALAAMVGVGGMTVLRLRRRWATQLLPVWWLLPPLALVGVGVSIYLTAVAVMSPCAQTDCLVVQAASQLFALAPIGPLSIALYVAILVTWIVVQVGGERWSVPGLRLLLLLTGGGFGLSIYLVGLEPFVIGAVCGWCLLSAGVMTLLFWSSAESYRTIRQGEHWRRQLYGE